MKIDLSCPIELWQYNMPHDGASECTFILGNLSDKAVVSVQVALICYDKDKSLLYRQVERVQGLYAAPGERFSILIVPTRTEGVASVDLLIEKVWFDDAMIWRRGSNPLTEYEPNALKPGRRLDTLKFVAGQDAVGYPSEQPSVWVCVCGRANPRASIMCCRCERQKATVFASFSRENIEQLNAIHEQRLDDQAKRAREDASRLAEERQREIDRKKQARRNTLRAIIAAVCIAALASVIVFWALPEVRYNAAVTSLDEGRYDEARAAFESMAGYRDSGELITQCDYRGALSSLGTGDLAKLESATAALEALGDYEESKIRLLDARFERAGARVQAGLYDEALSDYAGLSGYKGIDEAITEAKYQKAQAALDKGEYREALTLFTELEEYKDSALGTQESRYQLALTLLEKSERVEAAELLTQAGDYKDADMLLKSACYHIAADLELEGDDLSAGEYYLRAGDYEDAAERARASMYRAGGALMENKEYERAAQAYRSISDYEDAQKLADECVYNQAKALESEGKYREALALYESIPQEQDASERAKECRYQQALADLDGGEYVNAERMFMALGDYKDSQSLIKRARYRTAIDLVAQGDYEQAGALLTALGDFEDSKRQLRECEYRLAQKRLETGDYQGAIDDFTALDGYDESARFLQEAISGLAAKQLDEGDAEGAAVLIARLEKGDSRKQLAARAIEAADAVNQSGDTDKALAILTSLGDAEGAEDKRNELQYQLAQSARDSGDIRSAAVLFAVLGDYGDAKEQSDSCYKELYGDIYDAAQTAYRNKDYMAVADMLAQTDLSELPSAYRSLKTWFEDSAYRCANSLYDEGKQYEALKYYRMIPDYEDVPTKKLKSRCYLILGDWVTDDGRTAQFREDYTCTLLGEEMYYRVGKYVLETGASLDALKDTHRLTNLSEGELTLRDTRDDSNKATSFTRASEQEETAASSGDEP